MQYTLFYINAAQKVVGNDVQTGNVLTDHARCMVADTANETAALDYDVHRLRHKKFYAATKGMNLYLLIFGNGGISQIHTDTATKSIETGTMEHFATIDVLITAVVNAATDALTIFTNGQWTL